jgi:hypothetical protein
MGTTKSAVSRLESGGKHTPSAATFTSRSRGESRFRQAHVGVSARVAAFAASFPIKQLFRI